ncbi:hypothetical protein PUN28_010685 [Cardiocondyla obscurior]|uniref:Uncharacterized protein n=1 Tax=Cardiocondyla obscurior TaxID=286306 RepID=A0AAW2FIR5_9HYME
MPPLAEHFHSHAIHARACVYYRDIFFLRLVFFFFLLWTTKRSKVKN